MEFELHKRFRYSFDYGPDEYIIAVKQYLIHLSKINFESAKCLLTYFGLSYFHDSLLLKLNLNSEYRSLVIDLQRDDDKEDIDKFRELHKLAKLDYDQYSKHPFIYRCVFRGIMSCSLDIHSLDYACIIDTEIAQYSDGLYKIIISLSEEEEILITCNNVKVTTPSVELIKKYSDGFISEMPHCDKCKNSMLSDESLELMIKSIEAGMGTTYIPPAK